MEFPQVLASLHNNTLAHGTVTNNEMMLVFMNIKGHHLSTPSTVVISDFFHLRLGGDLQPQGVYSVCSSRPAFPTGLSVCWGGGGGGSTGFQFK